METLDLVCRAAGVYNGNACTVEVFTTQHWLVTRTIVNNVIASETRLPHFKTDTPDVKTFMHELVAKLKPEMETFLNNYKNNSNVEI